MTVALLGVTLALAVAAYRRRRIGLAIWVTLLVGLFLVTGRTAFLVVGLLSTGLLLGLPLFVVMGGVAMALLATVTGLASLDELTIVVRRLLELAGKEVLLAIPFFVVAGELMTQGSLARRLIEVMKAAFGFIPGGLAVAAVAACCFFAAISGSSPVTVVAIGSIMVPALRKAGYPDAFSVGLLTTAGSLGILIPPSIPMIVYSIMVSAATPVDPIDLFIAGVGPGLFIGGLLSVYAVVQGRRFGVPREPFSAARLWQAAREGLWSLLLPLIILGGIYSGIFTATEAAAVSVVYALAVELFIHRELDAKKLLRVAEASMTVLGSILVIIALAIALNYFLVDQQVPDRMVDWLKAQQLSPVAFLLVVNVLLLAVGCFMDIMSAILIIAPMLAPMAAAMGVDPVHMGIIFIVNLEIGYLTPPVGLNLFVSSSLFKKSLGFVVRAVAPTLAVMALGLLVVTWWPGLSLTLVRAFETVPSAAAATAAPERVEAEAGPPRVRSLEELMREARQADAGAALPRVKSLEELMREAKERSSGAEAAPMPERTESDSDPRDSPGPRRVKSLEELMREAKDRARAPADAG